MLGSARQSLEQLGLRHGLLETELFAGMVELIADNAAAAVAPLRAAYEGLGTLGVGADAGQAAALLARALLEQGDVDEADRMATASEELAGQNLKTAIAWRIARAEVLATRGDLVAALVHAGGAVEIAAATDLILDHADACVALAQLRERAGDSAGALRARSDALRLYDAKGATAPAERLGGPAASSVGTAISVGITVDELGATSAARPPYLDNAASRLLSAGDSGAADIANFADDVTIDDRRVGVSLGELHGAEAAIRTSETMDELFGPTEIEPIAIRGDRLVLVRTRAVSASGFEVVSYGIFETNDAEQISAMVFLDEIDLTAALAELDARYFAGEGAAHMEGLRVVGRYDVANSRDDFEAMRSLLSPDFVMVNHQALGFGDGDRDYFIEASRTRQQVAADGGRLIVSLCAAERAVLSVALGRSISEEGSEYERLDCVLFVLDNSGRISRMEWFPEAQYVEARTRFDELGEPPADRVPPYLDNPVVRLVRTTLDLMERGDWDAVSRLDGTAESIERIDRRRGMSAAPLHGPEEFGLNAFAFFDVFETITGEPVAIRGERLALIRLHCGQPDGLQLRLLALYECDEQGRMVFEADHDDDELAAALAELDARYVAGEGAAHGDILRVALALTDASRRDEFDAMRDLLSPDVVFEDHQPLGFGHGDRDYFFQVARSRTQFEAERFTIISSVQAGPNTLVATRASRSITDDNREHERTGCSVFRFNAATRINRIEWFPLDHYADAQARFAELGGSPDPASRVENDASLLVRRYIGAAARNDADEIDALANEICSEDIVRLDHRGGVAGAPLRGRAAIISLFRETFALFPHHSLEPVAVRGNRLALMKARFASDDGFEIRLVGLYELDETGKLAFFAHYDEPDLDSALARLEQLYVAGEGAEHEYMMRLVGDMVRAERRNDTAAWEALLAPERGAVNAIPDPECVPGTVTIRSDAALLYLDRAGRGAYRVVRSTAGRFVDLEDFAVAEGARATARFEALAAETRTPVLDNDLMRATARSDWLNRFDPDFDPLEMYHPDCVLIDKRRSVNAGEIAGREGVSTSISSGVAVFGALSVEMLATRGDDLILIRWRFEQDGGFNTPGLSVMAGDANHQVASIISFDDGDLVSAVAELEARHRAVTGAAYGPVDAFVAACESGTAAVAPGVAAPLPQLCAKSYAARNAVLAVWIDGTFTVVTLDGGGRATSCEPFPADRWTDALARFDELAAAPTTTHR
jgi:hypothetical protein